eukprot:GFYU01007253.1.p1 GENE.GFYU01007253.1~~GFYU01007253.1.p1  ORF type:complete len:228 (-),score=36.03 GFYU01007253.1:210-893(-)
MWRCQLSLACVALVFGYVTLPIVTADDGIKLGRSYSVQLQFVEFKGAAKALGEKGETPVSTLVETMMYDGVDKRNIKERYDFFHPEGRVTKVYKITEDPTKRLKYEIDTVTNKCLIKKLKKLPLGSPSYLKNARYVGTKVLEDPVMAATSWWQIRKIPGYPHKLDYYSGALNHNPIFLRGPLHEITFKDYLEQDLADEVFDPCEILPTLEKCEPDTGMTVPELSCNR